MVTLFCLAPAVESRFAFYAPLRPFWEQAGWTCFFFGANDADAHQLEAELCGDARVCMSYRCWSPEDTAHEFQVYDDRLADAYTPQMLSGTWMQRSDNPDTVFAAAYESSGYRLGDTAVIQAAENTVTLQITGILQDSEKIIGYNQYYAKTNDYRLVYAAAEINHAAQNLYLPRSEAEKLHGIYIANGIALINYGRALSEAEQSQNMEILTQYGLNFSIENDKIRQNSLDYIYGQLYMLSPVIAGAGILMLVSLVCSNAVFANRRRKTYAIYLLLGLTRRRCMEIAALLLTLIAAVIAAAALYLLPLLTPFQHVLVRFSIWQIRTLTALESCIR